MQWTIDVYPIGGSADRVWVKFTSGRRHFGKLNMKAKEWDVLRYILIEGARNYMDYEVDILIRDRDVTHAFAKGVYG